MISRKVWEWYSNEKVTQALLNFFENREVVPVFKEGFGKRPNVFNYRSEILKEVSQGAISFHASVERWKNPMLLEPGLTNEQLEKLRIGWDLVFDPDVPDFEIAKLAVKAIAKFLKQHRISDFLIKFSGGKGFHVIVPFETFPETIDFKPIQSWYPKLMEIVIEYFKNLIKEGLREELLSLDTPFNLAKRAQKNIAEIIDEEGVDPFKIINLDVFGVRHLIRAPYSLHEKTLLVSVPLKEKQIEKFEKELASPEFVKVKSINFEKSNLSEVLFVEAIDWYSYHKPKRKPVAKVEIPKKRITKIPKEFFPPSIKKILQGLADGRKRAIFILVTFLKNAGYSDKEIEEMIYEWNQRNKPPLRESYIRTQLRWHFRQERNLLPPNFEHPNFYKAMGIWTEECEKYKNPLSYAFAKFFQMFPKRKRK